MSSEFNRTEPMTVDGTATAPIHSHTHMHAGCMVHMPTNDGKVKSKASFFTSMPFINGIR